MGEGLRSLPRKVFKYLAHGAINYKSKKTSKMRFFT